MGAFTLAEQMLYTTMNLTAMGNERPLGTGTGFFYGVPLSAEIMVTLIVTNKHVIAGADSIVAMCHLGDGAQPPKPVGQYAECTINFRQGHGVFLHSDPDIDICAIGVSGLITEMSQSGHPLFVCQLGASLIPQDWESFDAIEDVVMVGCPNGLYDQKNNLPIARRGITATSLTKMYGGKEQFMVDLACFPGSSGSPIFVYNPESSFDRKSNTRAIGVSRLQFVGVLFAGPTITNTGGIVCAQPPRIEVSTMMHLGYAVRSSALLDIERQVRAANGI